MTMIILSFSDGAFIPTPFSFSLLSRSSSLLSSTNNLAFNPFQIFPRPLRRNIKKFRSMLMNTFIVPVDYRSIFNFTMLSESNMGSDNDDSENSSSTSSGYVVPSATSAASSSSSLVEYNLPPREIDIRGFVVPRVGEVVLYPGKWRNEDNVGVVNDLQFSQTTSQFLVQVKPLQRTAPNTFGLPYTSSRQKAKEIYQLKWFDVGQIRLAKNARPSESRSDTWYLENVRDGYAPSRTATLTQEEKDKIMREYIELKNKLFQDAVTAVAMATLAAFVIGARSSVPVVPKAYIWSILSGMQNAAAYLLGGISGLLYFRALQVRVDSIGPSLQSVSPWLKRLSAIRFLIPVFPFLTLTLIHADNNSVLPFSSLDSDATFSFLDQWRNIPKQEALSALLGLLTYKIPFIIESMSEVFRATSERRQAPSGGLVSRAIFAASRMYSEEQKKNQSQPKASSSRSASSSPSSPSPSPNNSSSNLGSLLNSDGKRGITPNHKFRPIIIAGPSAAGKSTLIRMLVAEYGSQFGYSVSHTTREPRPRERDGLDYYFVTKSWFEKMVNENKFLEYAFVHKHYYGTSFNAIQTVFQSGKHCILDIDIHGIEALRKNPDFDPVYIWVTARSIDVLRQRLARRRSMDPEVVETRIKTALEEMEYAATNNIFDRTIVNVNIQDSYLELVDTLKKVLGDSFQA